MMGLSDALRRTCMFWNCRGLTADKEQAIHQYLQNNKPLLIVLIETHRPPHQRWKTLSDYHTFDVPGMYINPDDKSRCSGGIALIVRNDCTAVAPIASSVLPGFNATEPYNIDTISSQWKGWSITVDGWSRPLLLVPIYLQSRPNKHRVELAPLQHHLDSLEDYVNDLSPNDRPFTLFCGDFNNNLRELGAAADDSINVLSEFTDRGFICHNNEYCFGKATHDKNGVLDLLLELPPVDDDPYLIESMRICDKGQLPLISDHYPIQFVLRESTPASHVSVKRMIWKTDKATDAQQRLFTSYIEDAIEMKDGNDRELPLRLSALSTFFAPRDGDNKAEALRLVEEALESINALINEAATENIGQRPVSEHNQPDWTADVRRLYKEMAAAHKQSRRAPADAALANAARAARKLFTDSFIAARKQKLADMKAAIEEEINLDREESRHRVAWSAAKRYSKFTQPKASSLKAGLKKPDGSTTTSMSGSQELLGDYYEKVFAQHPRGNDPPVGSPAAEADEKRDEELKQMEEELLRLRPPFGRSIGDKVLPLPDHYVLTNVEQVKQLLARTSTTTASGPDEISGTLIRWASESPAFCAAIALIFNFCYAFGVLPLLWRSANLLPIPKKSGPLDECNSFRPISITCILMRRLETLVKKKLQPVAEATLSRWQAGFRRHRSTRQQIMLLHHTITKALRFRRPSPSNNAIAKGQPMPIVFLDISKAFDSTPHDYLRLKVWQALKKVMTPELAAPILSFLTAFLSGRQFRILAQGLAAGDWKNITAGVPQGAVLSPILYAIFINDLIPDLSYDQGLNTDTTALAFADDLAIVPPINQSAEQRWDSIQLLLNVIGDWARRWGVRFSATKSACVWFRPANARSATAVTNLSSDKLVIPYSSTPNDSVILPYQKEYQYLGLWMDETLSGNKHFSHMIEKCSSVSRMLRSMIRPEGVPGLPIIHTLTKALLLPRITYGLPFLDLEQKQYDALNRLIQRPVLSAAALPWSVHRAGAASYFSLPTIEIHRDYSIVELVSSNLRLTNYSDIRSHPEYHPAFELVRSSCNHPMVEAALNQADDATLPSAPHSVIDHFPYAVDRLNGVDFLPRRYQVAPPIANEPAVWESNKFKQRCRQSSQQLQLKRAVMESRGRQFNVKGLRSHNKLSDVVGVKKGVMLPPLLGILDQVTDESELDTFIKNLPSSNTRKPALPFAVLYATPMHLRLRSRCILNRASGLAAVKHYHNNNPDPALRQCPHCSISGISIPQTLYHAIVQCPKYQAERLILLDKLKVLIKRIKERASKLALHKQILVDDNIIFMHIVLMSPFVVESFNIFRNKLALLLATGKFLEYINSINPL